MSFWDRAWNASLFGWANGPAGALALIAGLASMLLPALALARQGPEPLLPELRIEGFAPARPFAVGTDPVTLVATVRNVGKDPLPAGVVSAKLVCAGALDYLEGDTAPKLPGLGPSDSTSFRWRVQPTDSSGALVASFSLLYPGRMPVTRVLAIQHFAEPPRAGVPSQGPAPVARAGSDWAVLENGKVRLRVDYTSSNVPAAFLLSRTPSGWRQVAVSLPLAEVDSAEQGQRDFWETFRVDTAEALNGKQEAVLTLSGGFGLRWRATLALSLRAGSAVVDARLRMAPLRPLRLTAVRPWPLAAGDSLGDAAETTGPEPNGNGVVVAGRWADVTVGSLWPTSAPVGGWDSYPLESPAGAGYRVYGCTWQTPGAPVAVAPGALTEIRGRFFALTPSVTVDDARRVALPPGR